MIYLASLDWKLYSKIFNKAPAHLQIYTIKLMTGWLPVYHHLNKMLVNKQHCPLCNNDEMIGHLYQCTGRCCWQQQFIKNLQLKLQAIKTPAELHCPIITHFTNITTDPAQYTHHKHITVFVGFLPKKMDNRVIEFSPSEYIARTSSHILATQIGNMVIASRTRIVEGTKYIDP